MVYELTNYPNPTYNFDNKCRILEIYLLVNLKCIKDNVLISSVRPCADLHEQHSSPIFLTHLYETNPFIPKCQIYMKNVKFVISCYMTYERAGFYLSYMQIDCKDVIIYLHNTLYYAVISTFYYSYTTLLLREEYIDFH